VSRWMARAGLRVSDSIGFEAPLVPCWAKSHLLKGIDLLAARQTGERPAI
jgi:hypothetical protein